MTFAAQGLLALGVYLAIVCAVAVVARRARRDLTPADHFLAGRELGVLVLFLTLYATAYSGNSLLGYPGEAYRRGFSWIMATGFMLSIVVCFHALVPRLRRPRSGGREGVVPGPDVAQIDDQQIEIRERVGCRPQRCFALAVE